MYKRDLFCMCGVWVASDDVIDPPEVGANVGVDAGQPAHAAALAVTTDAS